MAHALVRSAPWSAAIVALSVLLAPGAVGARVDESRPTPPSPPTGATPAPSAPAPPAPDVSEGARLEAAAAYSERHDGLAMLVMREGTVIFERTRPGVSPAAHHDLASGTKSFAGAIAIAAVADGLLALDERVSDTIHEWRDDPKRRDVTIRQLLTLTSGVAGGGIGRPPSYRDAVATPSSAAPGSRFQYGPAPFQVFGELMRRKLAARAAKDAGSGVPESVEQYLHRRILDPIGLEVGAWKRDADGNIHLPSGASLAPREWAKFGELLRCNGEWQGESVLPGELLHESLRGTAANPRYGLTFWLNTAGRGLDPEEGLAPLRQRLRGAPQPSAVSARLPDLFMAAGMGKQRLYVIRSQGLVVVRQGALRRGSAFKDEEFLRLLLGE